MGVIYQLLGDYVNALNYNTKALDISRELNRKLFITYALGNMANLYKLLNQYDLAINYYNDTLIIVNEIGDRQLAAITLGNLGLLLIQLKNKDKAYECYQKQIKISKEIGYKAGLAAGYFSIANLNNDLGNFDLALKDYQKALIYYEETQNKRGVIGIKLNIGLLELQKCNYQKAIEILLECVEVTINLNIKFYQAYCFESLSLAYFRLKNYNDALKFIVDAIELFSNLKDQIKIDSCKIHLMKINFYRTDQIEIKLNLLKELEDIIKEKEYNDDYNEYLYEFWLLLKSLPINVVSEDSLEKVRQKCLEINLLKLKTEDTFTVREYIKELTSVMHDTGNSILESTD